MCAGRIVNTLDSSLHFTSIALSLNITGPTSRELLARAIHSDFIVRVPQPLYSSTLLRMCTYTDDSRLAFAHRAVRIRTKAGNNT